MKKSFLLITLGFSLTSLIASEMPPMPPGFFNTKDSEVKEKVKEVEAKEVGKTKEEVKKVRKANKQSFPVECNPIPPMLFNFPPPMQADVEKCNAKLNEPSSELLVKQLSKFEGVSVEVISVKESENFKRVYEVKYKFINKKDKKLNEKIVYSNSKATKFFTNKPVEVK